MGKTGLIIRREYLTRIRNRTFIIMCIIGPLLWAALIIVPAMLAGKNVLPRKIVVVDETGADMDISYARLFHDTMNLHFDLKYADQKLGDVKKMFRDSTQTSILWFPSNFMARDSADIHSATYVVKLLSKTEPGHEAINYIQSAISEEYRKDLMEVNHIPITAIELARRSISVDNVVNGQVSQSEVKAVVAWLAGILIYVYILIFGIQVMRSVVEEKTTRVIEVIISSVRPFQLMMGKIIGVALAGLTQLACWVILSVLIIMPIIHSIENKKLNPEAAKTEQITKTMPVQDNGGPHFEVNEEMEHTIGTILSIPWGNMITFFILYFMLGYLMYASLFAAVGSAVDSETDTQQFQFPVTLPLILSMVLSSSVIAEPNGPVSKWLSMIPFTSPVTMMMRLPYGGMSIWEPIISLAILFCSFLFMTWLASRIYRVGILMYGKKASWRELGKWIFYKA